MASSSSSSSKTEITIDLTEYFEKNLCAVCDEPRKNADNRYKKNHPGVYENKKPQHDEYCDASKKIFGTMSIPVCIDCWGRMCETCHGCGIPFSFAYHNSLGTLIMNKTTLVEESKDDHVCVHCFEKDVQQ